MSLPDVSVVVPVRDGAASLPGLLDALEAQDLDPARYETVVVDNASRDGSGELAAARGARVVHEPVANRSRARNAGVAAARAGLIAFTDADCRPDRGWLTALLACRGAAPLVAGAVEIETRRPPSAIERFEALTRFDQGSWVSDGWAATANLMVERSAFEAVGGLDPDWRHIGEDVDFCLRARDAGIALAYCPGAVVRHGAERSLEPVLRRAWRNGYSSAQARRWLGLGHVAWRHPRPLLSPRAALAWHRVAADGLGPGERRRLAAVAWLVYAGRTAGSLWWTARPARRRR